MSGTQIEPASHVVETWQLSRVGVFDADDWDAVNAALAGVEPQPLIQAWREEPEAAYRLAEARLALSADWLWAHVRLIDEDIFNLVQADGVPAFMKGDVVEFFWEQPGAARYFEMHVTPEGRRWDLTLPCVSEPVAAPYETVRFDDILTKSRIGTGQWEVLARWPRASWMAGAKFSICRYDWTRSNGTMTKVLSSTSRHLKCDFHRREDWKRLTGAEVSA